MNAYELVAKFVLTLTVIYLVRNAFKKRERAFLRSVAILVLGDIGRSPRMMYHAESFAQSNFQTYLIGYGGSTPIPSLGRLNVQLMRLAEVPVDLKRLPFILLAPLKIMVQVATILYTLLARIPHPPEYIMVQNPPSIPTLALVQLVCWIRGSKLIIDWHNLGYSILALRLGYDHVLVKVAKQFEHYFGRTADIHLFVTQAMCDHLVKAWDLRGEKVVLHDRPPAHFKKAEIFEIHDLFNSLAPHLTSQSLASFLPPFSSPQSTPLTRLSASGPSPVNVALDTSISDSYVSLSSLSSTFPALRHDRPVLLVSSTSWTPDEDFSILLKALRTYEYLARTANSVEDAGGDHRLPKVLMIVTGKGPDKKKYMDEVERLEKEQNWQWVRCRSLWLEAEDYPVLLGSADLGICLHSSSSKLDLPMKIVDMFGCGLPVCALGFECLDELVKDGQNGVIFHLGENDNAAHELAAQLNVLLRGFPDAQGLIELRKRFARTMSGQTLPTRHVQGEGEPVWGTWSENWDRMLKPLLLTDLERERAMGE